MIKSIFRFFGFSGGSNEGTSTSGVGGPPVPYPPDNKEPEEKTNEMDENKKEKNEDNKNDIKKELEKILAKIELLEKMGVHIDWEDITRRIGGERAVEELIDDLIRELKELIEKMKKS